MILSFASWDGFNCESPARYASLLSPCLDDGGDTSCCFAVPQGRHGTRLRPTGENVAHLCVHALHISPNYNIAPQCDSNRTFGVLTERQAGHAKVRRLFLDTPRICNNNRRMLLQGKKFQIAEGVKQMEGGGKRSRQVLEGSEEVASVRITECSRFQIPSCHWRVMILCSGVRAPIQLLPPHQGTRDRDPAGQSGPGTGRQCDRCQCQNDSDRDGRVPNV